ncbi:MAG: hypothetical protein ACREC0_15655 [Methylocella sp.]
MSEAAKAIGNPIGTFFGWVAGFVPEGPLRTLFIVVVGLCIAAIPFVYQFYLGLLAQGAKPEGSIERQDYDKLRASLAGGNLAARLYGKWLAAFLDGVERFFGDKEDKEKGIAHRTLFPRAFGLKNPAPLWTAPAFRCCLLLAMLYPIATIFFIWVVSGQVGPAEATLALKPHVPGWSRGFMAAVIGLEGFAAWRVARTIGERTMGWKPLAAWLVVAVASVFVAAYAGTFVGTFILVVAVLFVGAFFFVVAFTVASTGAFAGSVAFTLAVASFLVGAFLVAVAYIDVAVAYIGGFTGDFTLFFFVLPYYLAFCFFSLPFLLSLSLSIMLFLALSLSLSLPFTSSPLSLYLSHSLAL